MRNPAEESTDFAKAILNILDDFSDEKVQLRSTQNALLNILEDSDEEKKQIEAAQKAILNILDDFGHEKDRLELTQRALLNIMEDLEVEKQKVMQSNRDMAYEIAERKQAQEALRLANIAAEAANKELEAFSYSVAHDLRAPLRSIDGFSKALLEDCADQLNDEGKLYLDYVRESAQQMAQLIDDLLEFSRVSRHKIHRQRADLVPIAQEIITRLKRDHPSRVVEWVVPSELPAFGDSKLMGIVIENLLGNAWKFTGKRERARIELGCSQENGCTIYFVRDNGAGFSMEYVHKLFGVFQRLHTSNEFEGTGIGLATVQRIVNRHGGRVWAEGEVDRGAAFYFTLEEAL